MKNTAVFKCPSISEEPSATVLSHCASENLQMLESPKVSGHGGKRVGKQHSEVGYRLTLCFVFFDSDRKQ